MFFYFKRKGTNENYTDDKTLSRKDALPIADHHHVERILRVDRLGLARGGAGVEPGDDLLQGHAALVEGFAGEEHRRHRHDFARLDFVLEQGAVDGHVVDVRVQHSGRVQRLDHVRAVLARQRAIGFEAVFYLEG